MVINMMITQWFSLYEKTEKTIILKKKMKDVRYQLIQAINDNNYEQRDKLLAIYEVLLIEFENA
jgi:hypothetical protein